MRLITVEAAVKAFNQALTDIIEFPEIDEAEEAKQLIEKRFRDLVSHQKDTIGDDFIFWN